MLPKPDADDLKTTPDKSTVSNDESTTVHSLVEPKEEPLTSPDWISNLRNEISILAQMRKCRSQQRKRLKKLNEELTSLKNPLTAIVDLGPEEQTVIQGRVVDSNEIPSGQRLPLWWENKEVQ